MISEDAKALIEAMSRKFDDHELLVRIDERGKVYERSISVLFEKIAVSDEKLNGVIRLRDRFSGAIALLGMMSLILGIILTYQKVTGG